MAIFREAEFWIAVAFVIALVIMWWKGSSAIAAMLDARAAEIRGNLDEAKRLRDEAERTLADYKRRQQAGFDEAKAMAERAKAEVERLAEAAKVELAASLKRREIQAQERIAQAEAAAVSEVRIAAVDIAISAARQLIVQSLTLDRGSELIEQSIQALPNRLH